MAQQDKLGTRATTVRRLDTGEGDMVIVTYHDTDVVKWTAKKIILDSGGWRTATTKTRMNQASRQFGLGFSVFQEDYSWYVDLPNEEPLEFVDGMTLERELIDAA